MNTPDKAFDANKLIDVKNLVMAALMGVVAWQWSVNLDSRKRFEELIISNDKRLTERATWMRVTDIRLSIIEKNLGIDPLDTDSGIIKLD